MEFSDLTDEQRAKASACTTTEQLEALSGGSEWYEPAPGSPDDFRPIPGG